MRLKTKSSRKTQTVVDTGTILKIAVVVVVIALLNVVQFHSRYNLQAFSGGNGDEKGVSERKEVNRTRQRKITDSVCRNVTTKKNEEWRLLCSGGIIAAAESIILSESNQKLHISQIGAHTGFEENDPLAVGLASYLNLLTEEEKAPVTWTFIEPSPSNYKRLVQNLANHASYCQMNAINAAVMSDSLNSTDNLTFYSIDESIDPETGYDSKSGKTLPRWVTQVSGFSQQPILFTVNRGVWSNKGLNVWDYIVETNVTTMRYSELMKDTCKNDNLFLLLIDTEGFDCDIILGISPESQYLPMFLIYEHHQCGSHKQEATNTYLQTLGYKVIPTKGQNTVAYQQA
jgi:FkbM family methyltransferase